MAGAVRQGERPQPRVCIARLPVTAARIFGRDAELGWLEACWKHGVHLVTIVAWGGVGKSALVNRWLAGLRDRGWEGAEHIYGWSFCSQGTNRLGSADEFVDATLRWFGDPDPTAGSPWDKGERLAGLVRRTRTILILDGLEPLQWAPGEDGGRLKDPAVAALVRELGAHNLGMCLLTTRTAVTDLDPLAGGKVQCRDLGSLSDAAGAELLRARGAKGTEDELQAASREYEGHGLALTLLGSYVHKACKGDIRRRDRIPLMAGKPAQRMFATYEKWFARKPEMGILRMMGLFESPASEGELATLRARPPIPGLTSFLCNAGPHAWQRALAALQGAGLLVCREEVEKSVVDAHPLVRQHFGDFVQRNHPVAWQEGHRRLSRYLERQAPDQPATPEQMQPLFAAAVHACKAGEPQRAVREIVGPKIWRGEQGFGLKVLGAVGAEAAMLAAFFAPPWTRLSPGLEGVERMAVLHNAGYALRALGRMSEAGHLMERGLSLAVEEKNWANACRGAANLCELYLACGRLGEAASQVPSAVLYAHESKEEFRVMVIRVIEATIAHCAGKWEQAEAAFAEAEEMQKARRPLYPILNNVFGFRYCLFLIERGRHAEALERAATMLQWAKAEQTNLDVGLANLSVGLGGLYACRSGAMADVSEIENNLRSALGLIRLAQRYDYIPACYVGLAQFHLYFRNFAEARQSLDDAHRFAARLGFRLDETDAHLGYARLHLAQHAPAKAAEHIAEARALIRATGYHRRDAELAELEAEGSTTKVTERASAEVAPATAPPVRPASRGQGPRPAPATIDREDPDFMAEKFDLAILCALQTELEEVLRTGNEKWSDRPFEKDDPSTYHETTYTTTWGQRLRVIAAAPTQMGMPASAVLATKVVRRFRPDLVAMVGIAAGADRGAQNFGDVLAADCTFDYGSGKIREDGKRLRFVPDPKPLDCSPIVVDRLKHWTRETHHFDAIRRDFRPPPDWVLKLHVGPLGSGAAVVSAEAPLKQVSQHWRKLVGIEMEAYGVHLACKQAVREAPLFLCMKSVCDFADAKKDDDWQPYAAYTAAKLCERFLADEWENLKPPIAYDDWSLKSWGDAIAGNGQEEGSGFRVRLRHTSGGEGEDGGVWLQSGRRVDATSYSRLGFELRVRGGAQHGMEIKLETLDGTKQHRVFEGALRELGVDDGAWHRVSMSLAGVDAEIVGEVGRVVFATTSAKLPRNAEIELEVRRVVFFR